MPEKPINIPESESQEESSYNPEEVKWLEEQKAEFLRLKAEDTSESRKAALEIAKAVKKLKVEREPERFMPKEYMDLKVDISDYESIQNATVINDKIIFLGRKEIRTITDGEKIYFDFAGLGLDFLDHQGKMVAVGMTEDGDFFLGDESGKKLVNSDKAIVKPLPSGDRLLYMSLDEDDNATILDTDGKNYTNKFDHPVKDYFEVNGQPFFILQNPDAGMDYVVDENNNERTIGHQNIIEITGDGEDGVSYVYEQDKEYILDHRGTRYDLGIAQAVSHLAARGDIAVFASRRANVWSISKYDRAKDQVNTPLLHAIQEGNFPTGIEKIYEMKIIDDKKAYVLYLDRDEIKKKVFDI